jgi:hypothetical protein
MPNLGGRIYTDNVNSDGKDYFFEAGAGRFAESHKRLKKLLIELDLYNKKMKIPNDINFIDTQNKNLHHHTYYLDKIVKKFANKKKLLKELSKMYGIDIPNPKFNKLYHWQNGVGHWKKGYNTKFVKKHISKPFKDKNIFIAGENYSSYQGWIEGALETSQIVLKKILKKSKLKTRKYKKKTRNKTLKK